MSDIKLPSEDVIKDYVISALNEVDKLNAGAHKWRMSIPVQRSDSDVRISNALVCINPLLDERAALRAERDALAAEVARLRAIHEIMVSCDAYFPVLEELLSDGNVEVWAQLDAALGALVKES